MSASRTCTACGATLPAEATSCPRCLLRLGLDPPPRDPDSTEAARTLIASAPRAAEPPDLETVRRLFPQLVVEDLIGRGGMGAVYRARQPKLDRVVALKLLTTTDPAFGDRFLREARALARLAHPHIVSVFDFGETDGLAWLLMEHVDGCNLRDVLREGKLPPEKALAFVPPLCDALQYAHDEGVVHRDIKPENVLVSKDGTVKIADFGLAKLIGGAAEVTLTGARQVMGTPHYMAPEQVSSPHDVDHRADIYSLGVVLYEMLTGQLPLGRFAPPSRRVSIDVRLDDIVLRALEQEPERRYQHVVEVKTDVQAVGASPRPSAPVGAESPVSPAPTESADFPLAGILIGATVGAGVGGFIGTGVLWAWMVLGATVGAAIQVHNAPKLSKEAAQRGVRGWVRSTLSQCRTNFGKALVLLAWSFVAWEVTKHLVAGLGVFGAGAGLVVLLLVAWGGLAELVPGPRSAWGKALTTALLAAGLILLGLYLVASWQHGTRWDRTDPLMNAASLQARVLSRPARDDVFLLTDQEPPPVEAAITAWSFAPTLMSLSPSTYLVAALVALLFACWRTTRVAGPGRVLAMGIAGTGPLIVAGSLMSGLFLECGFQSVMSGLGGFPAALEPLSSDWYSVDEDLEEVTSTIRARLADRGYEVHGEATAAITAVEGGELLAERRKLYADLADPLDAWRLTADGPRRKLPHLVISLVGSPDGHKTIVGCGAGYLDDRDTPRRKEWQAWMESLMKLP